MTRPKKLKFIFFYTILLAPILIVSVAVAWLTCCTSLPKTLYLDSLRNIYFDCMRFVDQPYVYVMKPGVCYLDNFEYSTTLSHDRAGFRNGDHRESYDVVAIGDSHTHGFGVNDGEAYTHHLGALIGGNALNLGIGSYATLRELEALRLHGGKIANVVIQYSDNDYSENLATLAMSKENYTNEVKKGWTQYIQRYDVGKREGVVRHLKYLYKLLRNRDFVSLTDSRVLELREESIPDEAAKFTAIMSQYQAELRGKNVLIFESSAYGLNRSSFRYWFDKELGKLAWLSYTVLDSSSFLGRDDYYFLDDHLNPKGHRKVALALANALGENVSRPSWPITRPTGERGGPSN